MVHISIPYALSIGTKITALGRPWTAYPGTAELPKVFWWWRWWWWPSLVCLLPSLRQTDEWLLAPWIIRWQLFLSYDM